MFYSKLHTFLGTYSSPHHEWQDLRPQKYKLALYGSRAGSKTQSSSVSEISEPLDGLEWDSEDFGPMVTQNFRFDWD